tara:strand:+ start:1235 stop:2296 length:1062 start_codon:yes stop_codon:yes gene_type:complete
MSDTIKDTIFCSRFYCKKCDYSTSKKSSWNKHIKTKKHCKKVALKSENDIPFIPKLKKKLPITKKFKCNYCEKSYSHRPALYRHRKKCKKYIEQQLFDGQQLFDVQQKEYQKNEEEEKVKKSEEVKNLKSEISELKSIMKDMILSQKDIMDTQQDIMNSQIDRDKAIIKLAETKAITASQTVYNNCNNRNMTINVFLNEQCKDALNLTDWVQNIKVTLEDLEYTKDNGFVDGVTNIITKQLRDLKPTERPIHCSDKKRLQFYVKDNDEWTKDTNNKKLDETLRDVKLKLPKSLTEWEKMNPTYKNDPRLMDEWMNIMAGISEGDTGNILKEKMALKRKIATYIELKEAMASTK